MKTIFSATSAFVLFATAALADELPPAHPMAFVAGAQPEVNGRDTERRLVTQSRPSTL